jgi:glycosyltransferase involved in cell wall biosynthesis
MRPPHVVMLAPDEIVDRRILLEGRSLAREGFRVTLITAPELAGSPQNDAGDSEFYRVTIKRIDPQRSYATERKVPLEKLWHRLERDQLQKGKLKKSLHEYDWKQFYWYDEHYYQAAVAEEADLYIAHDLPMLPAALRAGTRKGAPVVYDAHELYPEQNHFPTEKQELCRRVESALIGLADAVITVNESIAGEMVRRYRLCKVPDVILNCTERLEAFDPSRRYHRLREALRLSEDQKIVLYQGGFSVNRNLENLVFSATYIETPHVVIVLMGNGALQLRLEEIAKRRGVYGTKVRFLPAVGQDVLLEYTASADVGLIPYPHVDLNTYYCTPNKLFEYIQAELPSLGNDSPELRKVIEGERIGLCRLMNSTQDIACGIDEILGSEVRLCFFRQNLRRASARYTWSVEGAKFCKVISAALGIGEG